MASLRECIYIDSSCAESDGSDTEGSLVDFVVPDSQVSVGEQSLPPASVFARQSQPSLASQSSVFMPHAASPFPSTPPPELRSRSLSSVENYSRRVPSVHRRRPLRPLSPGSGTTRRRIGNKTAEKISLPRSTLAASLKLSTLLIEILETTADAHSAALDAVHQIQDCLVRVAVVHNSVATTALQAAPDTPRAATDSSPFELPTPATTGKSRFRRATVISSDED